MSLELVNDKTESSLSIIKDPFSQDCVEEMMFRLYKDFSGNKKWYAKVEFVNGNTRAEQNFPNTEDFTALLTQVNEFLKSLKKN